MGDKMNKEQLFKEFNHLLSQYSFEHSLTTSEKFKLLNEYQNQLASDIDKSNNRQLVQDAYRTSMYELSDALKLAKYKKKYQLHRIVNLFCLGITNFDQIKYASPLEKDVFEFLLERSDDILENKDWYKRVIPNSNWLLNYFEFKKEENDK
jgi:hypothetical protein